MTSPISASPEDDDPPDQWPAEGLTPVAGTRASAALAAFQEFERLGTLGAVGYAWWKKQICHVANKYNFPPPTGHHIWTDEAAAEWLDGAFAKRGREFMTKVALRAVDDLSYGRVVRRSIKNELIDGAKGTVEGRLRSRMRTILPSEPGFIDATARFAGKAAWTLDSLGEGVWVGDWKDLLRLPNYAHETIEHLNPAGPTSKENKRKLVAATRAILERAGGAVSDRVLSQVLVQLFELEDVDLYLLGDEQVVTTDNTLEAIDTVIDRENGWEDPREYEGAVEWLKLVDEADALLAELTQQHKQTIARLDGESLGSAGPAFRARIAQAKARLGVRFSVCDLHIDVRQP